MPHEITQRLLQQTRVDILPHPSGRSGVMRIREAGLSHDPLITQLPQQQLYPSIYTEERWSRLYNQFGHCRLCRRTGNARATVLRGHDLVLLSLYRMVFPKATAAEINTFLYRANFGNVDFCFYSSSQISEAEKRIGLTRKRSSTTAHQALLGINIQKRWNFWNLAYDRY